MGEFYLKKGNFETAREIFTKLATISPETFQFPYFLGKIEAALGNHMAAIAFLEKTRGLNPFHKQTLLLLTKSYVETNKLGEALQCLVDSYLLCKETKDSRIEVYKKKIRNLAKKLPGMDDQQKNKLIKDRLKNLHERLKHFEADLYDAEPEDSVVQLDLLEITQPMPPIVDQTVEEEAPFILEGTVEEVNVISADVEPDPVPFPEMDQADDDIPMPETKGVVLNADFGLQSHPNIDFTRHILFKSLSVQEIEKIGKFSSIQNYAKGDRIHEPLESIYGFSCLLEGKIQVSHQGTNLLELHAGSIIDEAELCNGDKYFFESRAIEPATILMVNKAALMALCKRKHDLAAHFLWHFYKSLTLKISAVLDNIVQLELSKEMQWSVDRMWEVSQQRKLSELELDFLTRKYSKIVKYKSNFIFKIQDVTDFFYILLEGEVELEHPESHDIITIGPSEMFSEMALISNNFQHIMNCKVLSEQATLLQVARKELSKINDSADRDNYRVMEFLWNIFSKKYFEFVNFYFNLQKSKLP